MTYKKAELISVGTELLIGDIVNTNAAYLSRALAALGIGVFWQSVVGDNRERMREAFALAVSRADLVLVTGGLGPTNDDLTKEVAAEFFGEELVLHQPSLDAITSYLTARGIRISDSQKKQAMQPKNGVVFENRHGTAPGSGFFYPGGVLILLPGPPKECEPIFDEEVAPFLRRDAVGVLRSHNVYFFGVGEAIVGERLYDLLEHSENPTVAPYCTSGEVRLRVTASAATEEDADASIAVVIDKIRKSDVGQFVYGVDIKDLQHAAVAALRHAGATVAFAESCTAGYLAGRIGAVPGASAVMDGAVTAYAPRIKTALLGVDADMIEREGVVSEAVAAAMAEGVRKTVGADFGVSTTGVAGPGGGTERDPVGTVWIACAGKDRTVTKRLSLDPGRRTGEEAREHIRYLASSHALALLLSQIPKE